MVEESVTNEESLEVGAGLHLAYSPTETTSPSVDQVKSVQSICGNLMVPSLQESVDISKETDIQDLMAQLKNI